MHPEPQREHRWLEKLVGDWTVESECLMGPDQPPLKSQGVETVRSLGGLWTIAEGEGEVPGGSPMKSVMTLGYDPARGRFVGTFIASVMTHLWTYDGALDGDGKLLELDAEGPNFSGEGTSKYVDSIEFVDDDHRILRSRVLGDDGNWIPFMTAHYRRKA
jgi:hypothetical protein